MLVALRSDDLGIESTVGYLVINDWLYRRFVARHEQGSRDGEKSDEEARTIHISHTHGSSKLLH